MKLLRLSIFLGATMLSAFAHADSQPPSVPNNVEASALSDSSIRVHWNAPWDNVAVAGYNIYRDGNYHTTVRATNYIDKALQAGSTHQYEVVAFDDNSNYSSKSLTAQATANLSQSITGAVTPNTNGTATVPSGLSATTLNGNELRIDWQPSANAMGYNVYRDGAYYTTVNSGTSLIDRVNWGQNYTYTVASFTANNSFSSQSSAVIGNTAGGANENTFNDGSDANTNTNANTNASSISSSQSSSTGGAPEGYQLVFNDDFQGYSLDGSKWNSQYRWGPNWVINGEKQYYVDAINDPNFGHSPFEFDGEHLTINAIPTPDWLKDKANWQPYLSGALTTHNKFTMRYGYVEMRAKLPQGRGLWPAFWLLHNNDYDRRPEIDVVEMLGGQSNLVYHTYHHYENGQLKSTPSFEAWGPDYSADFHTYAVQWEPGLLIWYVDGVERNRYENGNVSWEDMYLLVNLALGGWWASDPDGSTPFPARFTIDYIRAWQKP